MGSKPPLCLPMTSNTTAGCFVALLALVLAVILRRRQRWRRTRPWLVKLRANKIEKEQSKERPKDHPKDHPKDEPRKVQEASDSLANKRTKERRKRGKESKPTRMTSVFKPRDAELLAPVSVQPSEGHSSPSTSRSHSPCRIPLPPSPIPNKIVPPALVLPPTSPTSTSLGVSTAELTATTPTTSTSISSTPSPFAVPSPSIRTKLPAFPPASPLPPSLARKQPSLACQPSRKSSAVSPKEPLTIERKPSQLEFPTPAPAVGKQDQGRKRKPSDVKKKGTPEATQIASLKGALEAARLREEEVAEERRAWQQRERDLQAQVNQLAHQLHALSLAFGVPPGYVPFGYGYGAEPPATPSLEVGGPPVGDQSHTPTPVLSPTLDLPPSNPLAPNTPTLGQPSLSYLPAPMHPFPLFMPSPINMPPHSPMTFGPHLPHGPPMMMSPPPQHAGSTSPPYHVAHPWNMAMNTPPLRTSHPVPGQHRFTGSPQPHRFTGSPQSRSFTGSPKSRSFTGSPRQIYSHPRQGTPSTPSEGARSGSLKREREPESETESSSEEESDDDSVIFEDGSMSDSLNLSLRGDTKDVTELPLKFDSFELSQATELRV